MRCKRFVQEPCRTFKARIRTLRTDDDADKACLPALCRRRKTEPRLLRKSRLAAVASLQFAQQFVGIRHGRHSSVRMAEVLQADARIIKERLML